MSKSMPTISLTDETQPRIKVLIERSAPNPDRPRLSDEVERALVEVETKTAAAYADNENRVARKRRLSKEMRSKLTRRK
jgi:hypothetical protein